MKTLLLTLSLLAATAPTAQALDLDRAAAAVAGKEASFTQSFTPKGFRNAQVESGTVIFGTLPQMRWTYTSPESKLFVFDGTRSWFYVPADKQVTVGVLDESRRRELPFVLLNDPAARDRHFNVKESTRGNSVTTTLTARDAAALIRSITITSNASDHLITRVDYSDRDGNRTSFALAGYHPRAASADTFRFSPPAGTQVTNAQ